MQKNLNVDILSIICLKSKINTERKTELFSNSGNTHLCMHWKTLNNQKYNHTIFWSFCGITCEKAQTLQHWLFSLLIQHDYICNSLNKHSIFVKVIIVCWIKRDGHNIPHQFPDGEFWAEHKLQFHLERLHIEMFCFPFRQKTTPLIHLKKQALSICW